MSDTKEKFELQKQSDLCILISPPLFDGIMLGSVTNLWTFIFRWNLNTGSSVSAIWIYNIKGLTFFFLNKQQF